MSAVLSVGGGYNPTRDLIAASKVGGGTLGDALGGVLDLFRRQDDDPTRIADLLEVRGLRLREVRLAVGKREGSLLVSIKFISERYPGSRVLTFDGPTQAELVQLRDRASEPGHSATVIVAPAVLQDVWRVAPLLSHGEQQALEAYRLHKLMREFKRDCD